jgi:hypothetical protein
LVVGRGVSPRDMDGAKINFRDLTPYLAYADNVFCFLSSLPLLFPATIAVFGSYLLTNTESPARACLSIYWRGFVGAQKRRAWAS